MFRQPSEKLFSLIFNSWARRDVADPNGFRMNFPQDRKAIGDYWFRQFLEAQEPKLRDDGISGLEKAHLVRRLVFRHVVRARLEPILQLRENDGFGVCEKSASELFMALDAKIGGILCSGSAYALMKTYALFGLESFLYHMGLPGTGFMHTVTIVTVNHQGHDLAVIEDAHFNLTVSRDEIDRAMAIFDQALSECAAA